jgi:hypothetical protein
VSFLSRAIMQYSCSEMVSPLLRRACTSRTAFQFVHRSEKPCLVRAHGALPRPARGRLQRHTRKQKSHLGPRGWRCEGDGGGSSLGLPEADSTHIAQRVASPMLRPRPPQYAPASAIPTGVTRTHHAAARGRRTRPWPCRRTRLRRVRPNAPDNQARVHARPTRACAHHPLRRCSTPAHSMPRPLSALRGTGRR